VKRGGTCLHDRPRVGTGEADFSKNGIDGELFQAAAKNSAMSFQPVEGTPADGEPPSGGIRDLALLRGLLAKNCASVSACACAMSPDETARH
jgi:hypothetical protein